MMWRIGPQTSWTFFVREKVAGAVDLGLVAHLEGDVMKLPSSLQEIDGVVVAAAAQEGEEVAAPVRHPEAEHVAVEFHRPCTSGTR